MITYLLFNAEMCDRAEFETPLNVALAPFLLLLPTHPWTSSCRGSIVEGSLLSTNHRCADRAHVGRIGGWERVGIERVGE